MMTPPNTFYTLRLRELTQQAHKLRNLARWTGAARLLVFLVLFPSVFVLIPAGLVSGLSVTTVLLVLFLFLVTRSQKLKRQQERLRHLQWINQQELRSLEYDYTAFDPGEEYMNTNHAYSYDMDLFGKGSVFQFVARTVTCEGKQLLARLFHTETLDTEQIRQRQLAVQELATRPELGQEFRAAGMTEPDAQSDLDVLRQWMNQPFVYLHRRGYRLVLRVLPALTVLCVIMALFFPPLRSVAILLFMVQLLWVGLQFRQTSAEHAILAKRQSLLYKYQGMFQVIENSSFQSPLLTEIHNELTRGEQAASHSIQSLARIVAAFDNRLNVLVALFLEGLLLWDMQCLLRLEHWRKTGSSSFEAWIAALARFDALVSLANLAFNQPELTYPEFSEQEVLTASRMGHLLISPADRVYNDFRLERPGDFVLITGANMAGKSTFLRTVASNIVLAMAGAPVCAASLVWKPTKLYSSMRTSDSLNKHESYFYAELKRLKELLDCLRNGEALFILLDEILKGTNSTDKQKGSRAVMEQILARQGTGIIATHDLELTKLEQQYPGRVRNLCFEIEIDRAAMHFDYKLRNGVTTKMNALLLMQQMGIVAPGHQE